MFARCGWQTRYNHPLFTQSALDGSSSVLGVGEMLEYIGCVFYSQSFIAVPLASRYLGAFILIVLNARRRTRSRVLNIPRPLLTRIVQREHHYTPDIIFLWLASLTGAALVFQILYRVSEETLLVVPSVGVQVKTQYWLGNEKTEFFDRSCVKGIIINEAITMQSVIYYLAVLLTNSKSGKVEQVYPLFTHSWPQLKDLVHMYQVVQNIWDNQHMMGLTSVTSEKDDYLCEGSSQGQTAAKDLMGGGDDRLRP